MVMAGRLLRSWLLRPLCSLERIRDRLDAVEELAFRSIERGKLRDVLKSVHDLERLVARAALGTAGPRDLVALRQSLTTIPRIRAVLQEVQAPLTARYRENPASALVTLRAEGTLGEEEISCAVATGRALVEARNTIDRMIDDYARAYQSAYAKRAAR